MTSRDRNHPNILMVTSDDQGPWAMACAGNPEIITPNLDRLAAVGVRFENLFCASPVCSPARASLLTGMTPSQHGVHDWIRGGNTSPGAIGYLDGVPTLSDDLAAAGYECGLSGKWHLGDSGRPQASFGHWFAQAGSHSSYVGAPMFRGSEPYEEPGYLTDVVSDDAIGFIGSAGEHDRPFFLSLNYMAPHHPWLGQHPEQFLDLYRGSSFQSCPQEPRHAWLHERMAPAVAEALVDPIPSLMAYFAAVTAMDEALGRVLKVLDAQGLRESTVVLFLSDNGFNCGHHGIWGKGNGTYPQNVYEESVKVPGIVSQPGRLPEDVVINELVSAYDVRPTLRDLAGISPAEDDALPGRSWLKMLGGDSRPEDFAVVFDEYGPTRMIRTTEWKYVSRHPDGPDELYWISVDPHERKNRIGDLAVRSTIDELAEQLRDWFNRYSITGKDGAQLPVTGRGQVARVDDDAGAAFV